MTMMTLRREATRTPGARFIPDFLTRVSTRVGGYFSRTRAEHQLEQLDDRLLLDIGLKRSDINTMVWGR